jgi:hypothetical protein
MLGREPVHLGRARMAVQTYSSPGLATRILIPAAGLGAGDFNTVACVNVHLGLYGSYGVHNINVSADSVLQDAWFFPVSENLSTDIYNLSKRCILVHGLEHRADTVRFVVLQRMA